jgi:hypothetical protein
MCTVAQQLDEKRRDALSDEIKAQTPNHLSTPPYSCPSSQPSENHNALQISLIRTEPSRATRLPNRSWEIITAFCRFTAHGAFIPSSSFSTTSDGTPRIVDVIGATITVDNTQPRCPE